MSRGPPATSRQKLVFEAIARGRSGCGAGRAESESRLRSWTASPPSPSSEPQQIQGLGVQPYISEPGVVSFWPVSSQVLRPERIIGQPP